MSFTFTSMAMAQHSYGKTVIYIVRHAEKDTGNNPGLTTAGQQRAGDLMRYLRHKNIHRIYTTNYRRNDMTADSLRLQLHIDTVHYSPKATSAKLFEMIKANADLNTHILFIGHSNTVPLLLKNFGYNDYPYSDLADNAFDDIFKLRFKKNKVKMKHKKYGKRYGPPSQVPMK